MIALRSALFYALFSLWTVLCSLLVVGTRPLGFARCWRFARLWCAGTLGLLRAICRVRVRIEGQDRLPAGVAVVLAKHQSALETVAMPLVIPPFVWVLKRELLWIPIFGWALAAIDAIAIRRASPRQALRQVIDQGLGFLRAGRWVAIFPEGTRTPVGRTGVYQASGVMLAKRAGVPIVPVAVATGHVWPPRDWRKRPGDAVIRVLDPIPADAVDALSRDALLARVRETIERETRRLEAETGAG